jgi:hypothetical protein
MTESDQLPANAAARAQALRKGLVYVPIALLPAVPVLLLAGIYWGLLTFVVLLTCCLVLLAPRALAAFATLPEGRARRQGRWP